MQTVMTPAQKVAPLEGQGTVNRQWYLFFTAIAGAIGEFIQNAVYGKASLVHPGKLVTVTAAGAIGESSLAAAGLTDLVTGAANLTTVGAIPKVSADGTLDESILKDDGAGNVTAAGNLAITGSLSAAVVPYSGVGKTGSITTRNIRTAANAVAPAGQYLVTVYLTVNPTGSATVAAAISWKDTRSLVVTRNVTYGASAAAGLSTDVFAIECNGVDDLTLTVTLTNTATYNIYVSAVKLQ